MSTKLFFEFGKDIKKTISFKNINFMLDVYFYE